MPHVSSWSRSSTTARTFIEDMRNMLLAESRTGIRHSGDAVEGVRPRPDPPAGRSSGAPGDGRLRRFGGVPKDTGPGRPTGAGERRRSNCSAPGRRLGTGHGPARASRRVARGAGIAGTLPLARGCGRPKARPRGARRIESGYKIVYKPRSLAVENHFGEFMGWLDERGSLRESLRMPRVLDRGSHGWAEFVFKQDCGPMRLLIPGAHIIAPFLAAAVGRVSMFTSGT